MVSIKITKMENINNLLYDACRKGDKSGAMFLMEKGAKEWNWGLYGACEVGNKEIVLMMIEKGVNEWNWGLYGVCEGGNKEIVLMMIEKGATNIHGNVKYPKDENMLIYLIQNGITKDKLKGVVDIELLYKKLEEINEIMKCIMPKELIRIVEEYI